MTTPHIVVIGGGIGGLVSASLLANAGCRVTLFEANSRTGGKMGRIEADGCVFDTGPSLLTLPSVLDGVARRLGRTLSDLLEIAPVDPACHYRWDDGTLLDLPNSHHAVAGAIDAIAPGDGAAVERYLEQACRVWEATKDVFVFAPFAGFREFFRTKNLPLLRLLPAMRTTTTLHDHHHRTFRDRRVVQLFDRFATYNGSSPYRAPATLMVIPWVEMAEGAWYPRGGMYRIAEMLTTLATEQGVRIVTDTTVARIRHDNRRVGGVELADGEVIPADHVISNADVHVTRSRLLGERRPPPSDPSMAGLVMLLSVDTTTGHGLRHHNVFFSRDYRREFHDITVRRVPADDMTIYLARSCHSDPTQAADGRENWFVLVNAPATGDGRWASTGEAYADRVLERLAAFGVRPSIRRRIVRTPDTMAAEWHSWNGSLYGASSNSMLSAFMRPRQRSSRFTNLWYVGGSAHPGGGIPLVAASGCIAADLLLATL